MCATPRTVDESRPIDAVTITEAVAWDCSFWNSWSLGTTTCTCAASTPSMLSMVDAIVALQRALVVDLLLEVGVDEARLVEDA